METFRWQLEAIEPPHRDPGQGVTLTMTGSHGSRATIAVYQTRQGLWSWSWRESWLGHTTVTEPRHSWHRREHAVHNLAVAAVLFRLPGLAQDMLNWR